MTASHGHVAFETCEVAVVGGGITGASTALHLAQAGIDTALFERYQVNEDASGRNAGSLHGQIQFPSFQEFGDSWARRFLPALEFLRQSLTLWDGLSDVVGKDLEVRRSGGLLVAQTADQMRAIERKVAIENSIGLSSDVLDAASLQAVAPYVSPSMVGAELCHAEGKANPLLAAPAMVAAAAAASARIHTMTEVIGAERDGSGYRVNTTRGPVLCRSIVCCTGSGLNAIAPLVRHRLPLEAEPVQVSATEPAEPFCNHLIYFAGDKLTLKQARAGTVLIGGGWPSILDPRQGPQPIVSLDSLLANLAVAVTVVPRVASLRVLRSWAGIGVGTPDLLPIVGRVHPDENVFFGMFPHMGFTAGPLLGRTLAELALGRRPEIDVSAFSADRF